jgi:hypothetical protein
MCESILIGYRRQTRGRCSICIITPYFIAANPNSRFLLASSFSFDSCLARVFDHEDETIYSPKRRDFSEITRRFNPLHNLNSLQRVVGIMICYGLDDQELGVPVPVR